MNVASSLFAWCDRGRHSLSQLHDNSEALKMGFSLF